MLPQYIYIYIYHFFPSHRKITNAVMVFASLAIHQRNKKKDMFYLSKQSSHLLFTIISSWDISLKTKQVICEKICCRSTMGYFLNIYQQQEIFYMHHSIDRIIHTMAQVKLVVGHWSEWGKKPMTQIISGEPSNHRAKSLPRLA